MNQMESLWAVAWCKCSMSLSDSSIWGLDFMLLYHLRKYVSMRLGHAMRKCPLGITTYIVAVSSEVILKYQLLTFLKEIKYNSESHC